jgi:hypothetical protein
MTNSSDAIDLIQKMQETAIKKCSFNKDEIEKKINFLNKIEIICSVSIVTQPNFQEDPIDPKFIAITDTPSSHFLIGLALKKPNNSIKNPNINEINEIFKLLISYFEYYPLTLFPSITQTSSDDRIIFSARSQQLIGQINHERYFFQTEELINEIFTCVNDFFSERWGFTVENAIQSSKKILDFCTSNLIDKFERIREFNDEIQTRELYNENSKIFEIDSERICKTASIDLDIFTSYLKALSCEFGSQNQSYEGPLNENILFKKPIIFFNKKYYSPIPQELIQNLPAIFENLLSEEKQNNTKIWQKYLDRRANFTEEKVQDFLIRLFSKDEIYQNLYYHYENRRYEVDKLIFYCNNVIIIEIKSRTFSESAKRGGIKRIATDIGRIVADAYEQGLKTKEFIESESIAKFEDSKGNVVLELRNNQKLNFILINVTYEPLIGFSPSLKKLQKLGLFKNNEFPWSVNLFDLDIITRHVETPSIFIHYIESRLKTQEEEIIQSPDELTYFGFYLQFGTFRLESYDGKKFNGMFLDSSFLDKFDQHYLFQKDPPRLEIEKEIMKIIKDLEKLRPDNFTNLTNTLLDLDHRTRKDIIEWMGKIIFNTQIDGNRHDFTMMDKENKLGITLISQIGRENLQTTLIGYCSLKKYQCKKDKWIGLGIDILDPNYQVHEFFFDDSKWKKDITKEKAVKLAISKKMLRNQPDFNLHSK